MKKLLALALLLPSILFAATTTTPGSGTGGSSTGGISSATSTAIAVAVGRTNSIAATNDVLRALTNSGSLSVNMHRLGWLARALITGTNLNVAFIADTAPYEASIYDSLTRHVGYNGFDLPFGNFIALTSGNVTNFAPADGLRATTNWPVGFQEYGPGAFVIYSNANTWAAVPGETPANRVTARLIGDANTTPSARVYTKTNGGTWTLRSSTDTSGAHRYVGVTNDVLTGHYQLMISNNSATAIMRTASGGGGGMRDTNSRGVTISHLVTGNFDITHLVRHSTNITIPAFRAMNFTLAYLTEISGAANHATNGVALATFATNALPFGHLVTVGVWPLGDGTHYEMSQAQRSNSIVSGQPFIDGAQVLANYYQVTNIAGIGDTTHVEPPGEGVIGQGVWRETGFDAMLEVARSARTMSGYVPARNDDQTWTGLNRFSRYMEIYGADAALTLYDRANDPRGLDVVNTSKTRFDNNELIFTLNNGDYHKFALGNVFHLYMDSNAAPVNMVGQLADGRLVKTPLSSGGSQTPWASDIDGANFSLRRVAQLSVGGNTNVIFIVSNSSVTGPGVLHMLATSNGLPVGSPVMSWNLTNKNVGIAGSATVSGGITAGWGITAGSTIRANTFSGATSLALDGAGTLSVQAVDVYKFNSSLVVTGSVGIGTISPRDKLEVSGGVLAIGHSFTTNSFTGTTFWFGTNKTIVSSSNIYITALGNMPTETERLGQLTIIAGATITITNLGALFVTEGGTNRVTSRTIAAGERWMLGASTQVPLFTNAVAVKF